MLIEEAKWIYRQIKARGLENFYPMLNIGSSTKKFAFKIQPWIGEYIQKPGKNLGGIVCVDQKRGEGIDIVGDFLDNGFLEKVKSYHFKSILFSNVLEHVTDPKRLCEKIQELVSPGGYLLVSCPYKYPFHFDPIDTGYRPAPSEISANFPNLVSEAEEIVVDKSFSGYLFRDFRSFSRSIVLLVLPLYKPKEWVNRVMSYMWMFRRFSASCVVLKRV